MSLCRPLPEFSGILALVMIDALSRIRCPEYRTAHSLVELALPVYFIATGDDVERILTHQTLPHLRRLRMGENNNDDGMLLGYCASRVPNVSLTFLEQLDFLQVHDQTLLGPGPRTLPPTHAYNSTWTPLLFELSSIQVLELAPQPPTFFRHLFVQTGLDHDRDLRILQRTIQDTSLEALFVSQKVACLPVAQFNAVRAVCQAAGVDLVVAAEDKYAVVLPAFVEYVRAREQRETGSA